MINYIKHALGMKAGNAPRETFEDALKKMHAPEVSAFLSFLLAQTKASMLHRFFELAFCAGYTVNIHGELVRGKVFTPKSEVDATGIAFSLGYVTVQLIGPGGARVGVVQLNTTELPSDLFVDAFDNPRIQRMIDATNDQAVDVSHLLYLSPQ